MKIKIEVNDLTQGDRLRAYGSLWTLIDFSDENTGVIKKITGPHPGSNTSVCSIDRTEIVEFIPPREEDYREHA